MPAACPTNPDGTKRKVPKEGEIKHVTLFQSNDEGQDYEQARLPCLMPVSLSALRRSWLT